MFKLSKQCGRCPRQELFDITLEDAMKHAKVDSKAKPKALVILVDGKELVAYESLCEECKGITEAACAAALPQQKKSARRFKRVSAETDSQARAPARAAAARGE